MSPGETGGAPAVRLPGVVAITFTTAAAAEMRDRVQGSIRSTIRGTPRGSAERRAWQQVLDILPSARISTIHAFCASLLREHPLAARDLAGVTPGFEVLDAAEALSLRSEAFEGLLERWSAEQGPLWEEYLALAAERGAPVVADMLRTLEDHRFATTPKDLLSPTEPVSPSAAGASPEGAKTGNPRVRETLGRLWKELQQEYREAKRERGALDFDDLEEHALTLAQDPRTGRVVRNGIRHLLVDEFQDVSSRQLELLLLLRGADPPQVRALFGVGDPKQSIYAFRGARGALEGLRSSLPGLREARLEQTRRFRDPLASFVNHLSTTLLPANAIGGPYERVLPAPPSPERPGAATHVEITWFEGPLRAAAARGGRDDVRAQLLARFSDPSLAGPVPPEERIERAEAEGIADWVVRRISEGALVAAWRPEDGGKSHPIGPGDIAILLSYRRHQDEYVAALRARGLKTVCHPGTGFHGRPEVQDVLNLLAVLAREGDDVALYAALRSPYFGLSDEEIAHWYLPLERTPSLGEVLRDAATREPGSRAAEVQGQLERWRTARDRLAPSELLRSALDEVGAWGALTDDGRGGRAIANVEKLLDVIRDLPGSGVVGLTAIHRHLLEVQAREEDEPEAGVDLARDAINLMTVHGAKGLEFPVVVLPGLHRLWNAPRGNLFVSPTGEVALEEAPEAPTTPEGGPAEQDPTSGEAKAPAAPQDLERVQAEIALDQELEARRLLYVAITRAREHLLMTYVQRRTSTGAPMSSARELWRNWVNEAFHVEAQTEPETTTPEGWRFRRVARSSTTPDTSGPPRASSRAPDRLDELAKEALEGAPAAAGAPPSSAIVQLQPPGQLLRGGDRVTFWVTEIDRLRRCELQWLAWRKGELNESAEASLSAPGTGAPGELPPSRRGPDPRLLGIAMHDFLARGSPLEESDLRSMLAARFPEGGAPFAEEMIAAVKWTFQQEAGIAGGAPLREAPFVLEVGNANLRGRIDALFLTGGVPVVEDYKFVGSGGMSEREQHETFGFQLSCYALAVRQGRRPVHVRTLLPLSRSSAAWELSPLELDQTAEELASATERAMRVLDGKEAPRRCGRADCSACART